MIRLLAMTIRYAVHTPLFPVLSICLIDIRYALYNAMKKIMHMARVAMA